MDTYEKHEWETLAGIWETQCTVWITFIGFSLARVARYMFIQTNVKVQQLKIYLFEFLLISVLPVVGVNILSPYVEYIIALYALLLAILVWHSKCLKNVAHRQFEFGRRPAVFTVLRSGLYLLTSVCITAVDFKSFPKNYYKTRKYGAAVMDAGIGAFVTSMAATSSGPKRLADLQKSVFTCTILLVLGTARTLVIRAIDYYQDEHEYGTHLNAFFTLALTKLFATLLLFFIKDDKHVLPLGAAILVFHEITLQLGLSSFVLDPDLERTNFLASNREGLCSIPGFIALYLISHHCGQWLKDKDILNFEEIKGKLKQICFVSAVGWLMVLGSTASIGIARVTCNLGYVAWMLASNGTLTCVYLFVFEIVIDTVYPINSDKALNGSVQNESAVMEEARIPNKPIFGSTRYSRIPFIIEAINYNCLFFFLISNLLTGIVNIALKPEERTSMESVLILLGYTFITTGVVSLVYYFKIRIG